MLEGGESVGLLVMLVMLEPQACKPSCWSASHHAGHAGQPSAVMLVMLEPGAGNALSAGDARPLRSSVGPSVKRPNVMYASSPT